MGRWRAEPGDALSIVDDDLSGNKSNLFTALAYKDVVTLDTQGTATHNLTITYKFDSSTHPELLRYLYGRRVYRTYLRVYTSPGRETQRARWVQRTASAVSADQQER